MNSKSRSKTARVGRDPHALLGMLALLMADVPPPTPRPRPDSPPNDGVWTSAELVHTGTYFLRPVGGGASYPETLRPGYALPDGFERSVLPIPSPEEQALMERVCRTSIARYIAREHGTTVEFNRAYGMWKHAVADLINSR